MHQRGDEHFPIPRMRAACAVPMLLATHIPRSREQQARHIAFPDPFTHVLGEVRMHVSQYHHIDVGFFQPAPRQAFQQTR
ncbi:hypothetical protein D9M71_448790 [compost metagenome]